MTTDRTSTPNASQRLRPSSGPRLPISLELGHDWWPDELHVVTVAPRNLAGAPPSPPSEHAIRVSRAIQILIVETMAGRRPMSQLARVCEPHTIARMRRWPKGPGWSRLLLVGDPKVRQSGNRIDAVGILDLRGRRLPLATGLVHTDGSWRLDAVELVINPRVSALLTSRRVA